MKKSRIFSALCALSAVGIVLFWVNWFASGDYRTAGDACYRIFENTFPLPDGILALLLLATAWGVWRGRRWTACTGLLAGGMLFQLSALDTLYHFQHGGFSDWNDGEIWSRIFISIFTAALGLGCAWRFRAQGSASLPSSRHHLAAAGLLLLTAGFTAVYWFGKFQAGPGAPDDCEQVFHWAFWLADGITFLLACGGAAGLFLRRAWGLTATLLCTGMLLFGTSIYTAFALLNPAFIAGQGLAYTLLIVTFLAAIAYLTYVAWLSWPE